MADMRNAAQQLAAKGRFGDTMLLHVSPAEVEGIASLIPGGLTINPHTGLPEAFFFLPFLASLFGAAAPAAAAATAAAPALAAAGTAAAGTAAAAAPAIASGLGAAGAATGATGLTGLLHTLGTVPGMVAKGIGSVFGGAAPAATTAAAAPAATSAIAPTVLTHSVTAGAPAVNLANAATAAKGVASLPAAVNVLPTANPGLQAAGTALRHVGGATSTAPTAFASNPAAGGVVHVGGAGSTPASFATTPAVAPPVTIAPQTAVKPTTTPPAKGGLGSMMTMKNLPLIMMGASAASNALGGLFQKKDKEEKSKDISKEKFSIAQPGSMTPSFPGSDYSPGHSGEWNYFPNYQYANGGIVTLADGGMVDPQMQQPQDLSFPQNGVPAAPGGDEAPALEDIPSSPYPTSQIGTQPEPPPGETAEPTSHNDRELIAQTVEAIQGKVADPGPILLAFVNEFGEPALQDLAQRVKSMPSGGGPAGPGDGQSDSVPAMIDGKQPAALSQGEFVVPADAVSHLGNGSTDAGAQHLQGMVDNVRQQRTGTPQPPPQMNAGGLVPGYYNGGIVSLKGGGHVRHPPEPTTVAEEAPGYWSKFFNPFSTPPGELERGQPSFRELETPYVNESIMPAWMDQYVPSVKGIATTGDPFATQQEMNRAIRAKGLPF